MAEGNNQGRALLRILREATQMIDAPSDARQDASTLQEFTTGTFPLALPTTHVRGAAAGEQQEDAQPLPTVSYVSEPPCPLPRPGASAAVPLRSSGADLLARLQGTPTSTLPTMTCQQRQQPQHQNQYWPVQQQYQHDDHPPQRDLAPAEAPRRYHQHQQQYHQHHHQYQHQYSHHQQQQQYASSSAPPTVTRRSVAAEQERFLKKFLSIESPETESRSSIFSPAPTLSPTPSLPTSAAMSTPAASESGGGGEGGGRSSTSRAKDRGKSKGPRGGPTRGGGGSGGGTEDSAMTSSTPKRESKKSVSSGRRNTEASNREKGGRKGRGARSHNELGSRESKKGWKGGGTRNGGGGGGGGGGRGGGRSKVLSPSPPATPAYAWSSFQNSPDPKNIPIPPLSHLSLSSDVSAGDEGLVLEETVTNCRDDMMVEDEVLNTPPPPPPQLAEGCARTEGEPRSAAKRAEDDIKRMLRLG